MLDHRGARPTAEPDTQARSGAGPARQSARTAGSGLRQRQRWISDQQYRHHDRIPREQHGTFDPADAVCLKAKKAGAWVHVDGAFGMWAAATPQKSALAKGVGNANSWATDAHKWLNVPYDSGLVFVREARPLLAAMSSHAAYLIEGGKREPSRSQTGLAVKKPRLRG